MNKYEIRTCGVARSGNYAIVHWLMAHFQKGIYHRFHALPGQSFIKNGTMPYSLHNCSISTPFIAGANNNILYSYENVDLQDVERNLGSLVPNRIDDLGNSEKEFDLLILRDPFNLLASYRAHRLKCGHLTRDIQKGSKRNVLPLWKMYAEEAIGQTDYINNRIVVLFNHWFSNEMYRRNLSAKLGLEFTDKQIDYVSGAGSGSSFDGISYRGRGSEMKVLERWKVYAGIPQFKRLFKDGDIWDMSRELFGEIPGTEVLKG